MTANGDPAAPVVHPPRWSWYCADCGTRGEVQTWEGGDSFDAWTRVHEQHKERRYLKCAGRRISLVTPDGHSAMGSTA